MLLPFVLRWQYQVLSVSLSLLKLIDAAGLVLAERTI